MEESIRFELMAQVTVTVRSQVLGRGRVIGRTYASPMRYDVKFIDGGIIADVTAEQISNE